MSRASNEAKAKSKLRRVTSFNTMKKQDKVFEVQNLSAKIKEAKTVALIDYRGIKANQINQLRDQIRGAGGELQVTKNNLLYRALKENNYQVQKGQFTTGPTLTLFANADEIAPLKILVDFGKGISLLPLKIGFMAGQIISTEELNRFASLPGKKELQAKLVAMLANQPRQLVYSLNWNIQKLVLVLNGIKEKKPN